jgi:hypothetical protein
MQGQGAKVKKRRFVVCQLAGARQRFNSQQNESMPCALPNPHGKVFKFARHPRRALESNFCGNISVKLKIKILKRLPCVIAGHTTKPVR